MTPWKEAWFGAAAKRRSELWRGVEAQHLIATMRLVDTVEEQEVLERLLDSSKPALPPEAKGRHFLVTTPFRYISPVASRFRPPGAPGIWYGAETVRTVCAEIAYWRWRFVMASDGLAGQAVHTQHSVFPAVADGVVLDLTTPPWSARMTLWRHRGDYSACHALASAARERAVQWLRYRSARDSDGICGAVLTPAILSVRRLERQQTWACKVSAAQIFMQRDSERIAFDPGGWA